MKYMYALSGSAEGFAKGVTGGGSATAVYLQLPMSWFHMISLILKAPQLPPDAPLGNCFGLPDAINQNDWRTSYQPDAPSVSVTYYNAGALDITVAPDKTLIGSGSSGIIKVKGLRIVGGATNIIIHEVADIFSFKNIAITDINPGYVWGDAISIDDADLLWIDHVTTARIGRQHLVHGTSADNRVTVSKPYFAGVTSYSATGRAPKVQGNTLLHAVNNYRYDSSGHAFEIGSGDYVLAEGRLFTSPSTSENTVCETYLGRDCVINGFGSSGTFSESDTGSLSDFESKNLAIASAYTVVQTSVL
ncbi:pectin lyase fold/virulence factor [Talaromyces proteolyticus]|uniref:pectin lyase n=1 Tax=Talaromyces proteolyticus TaxID=1131652 RepID=A0AAD4KWG7_9EURO|nr:pectin lyase fold/virulence factor [Talaromyces proteolyticus]KAH8698433.1 pectin lyase fold/virulence factor [Talaromyces proteolyticus]